MKRYFSLFIFLLIYSTSHAQFSAVSTNLTGWAVGNVNIAVDVSIDRHNTINIPASINPFRFGETQWGHIVVQPGWRHWFTERYLGHFISPSLFYAGYDIHYNKKQYKGNAYGMGLSWGYSILLSTRWNFLVEFGVGIIYTPYDEKLLPRYIGEFDDEHTYHHQRFLLLPTKCNLSFSYLF